MIRGLLECEQGAISTLGRFSHRKNSLSCNKTTIKVIKTIRIHLSGVLPWIRKYPQLKVIKQTMFTTLPLPYMHLDNQNQLSTNFQAIVNY